MNVLAEKVAIVTGLVPALAEQLRCGLHKKGKAVCSELARYSEAAHHFDMNLFEPTTHSVEILLRRLRAWQEVPGRSDCARIAAQREHSAKSVDIERPALAIIVAGRKRVRCRGQVLDLAPGDLLFVAQRCVLDVTNIPDATHGLYLTYTIPICDEVIEATRLFWNSPATSTDDTIARVPLHMLLDELERWSQALCAGSNAEARLAMTAAMLRLCRLGHTRFLVPPLLTVADQIRTLVRSDPERNWQSHDIEAALGVSGATLRRRLSSQQQTLRDVIAHTRLACALDLLYTTRWPIKTVAARVGYRSVSSFVQRFIDRYDMDPGSIGNTPHT